MSRNQILKNLQIQFNENIIKLVKNYNLSVEHIGSALFILFALYEGRIDLLDTFDDNNKEKRALLLYRQLLRRGLIEENDKESNILYIVTNEGIKLIDVITSEFERIDNIEIHAENLEKLVEKESIDDWIKDWIKLFPESKVGGRYLRSNSKDTLEKMKWFVNTYEFDKETIFDATKSYLLNQERSNDGHMYTRNSSYFISKNQGRTKSDKTSDLATWCELIVNQKESGETPILEDPFAKIM